jgi:hypothetical protein
MNVKNYIGKDADLSNEETSRRFTKRHALGLWCAVLPFAGFFAAGYGLKQSNGHIAAIVAFWASGLSAFCRPDRGGWLLSMR